MPTEIGREWDGWRKSANSFVAKSTKFVKWPIGTLSFALIPAAMMALLDMSSTVLENWMEFTSLLSGIILYSTIRYTFLGENSWIRTIEVLHHEVIHAVVAILSFCTIEEIKATRTGGGHMKYKGQGNWLITLSPYFLPLIPITVAFVSIFVDSPYSYFAIGLTGFSMGFYYVSLRDDLHMYQTDLKKVGLPFLLIFIVPINIILIYLIVLISTQGMSGFEIWAQTLATNTYEFFKEQI
tara:strand:+ start:74 stop:790 length:717 start_codon:yes stop_codon:yes gene_type:complete